MAAAARPRAEALARLAVEETGYGVVADKVQKNLFASERVYEFIRPMRTVGVVAPRRGRKVVEIAEPFGVVAAIVPSTNPTSTAIYKILIALKARCPIVHQPASVGRALHHARGRSHGRRPRRSAGAPDGAINWMHTVTLEGTQELMKHRDVAVILATGGMGLVRAAYSAGKPAYGVGPGNAPCFIERTADSPRPRATSSPARPSTTACCARRPTPSSSTSAVADEVKREFVRQGALLPVDRPRSTGSAAVLVTPQRLPNPALVGKSAPFIAETGRHHRPAGHARADRRARRASAATIRCRSRSSARCSRTTSSRTGARGASAASRSCATAAWVTRCRFTRGTTTVILEFGLKKPAFRIVVNTPTTHGSIGLTTGLDPAMTLGCGGYGGNITSDNISPRHLLNIKRLAYELRPARRSRPAGDDRPGGGPGRDAGANLPRCPKLAARPPAEHHRRLAHAAAGRGASWRHGPGQLRVRAAASDSPQRPSRTFVCEDDVRQAIKPDAQIVIGEQTIVTPAARDLAEANEIFVESVAAMTS